MKKSMILAAFAAALISGCSTALVTNEARCTVTAPDGTVTERYAKNKIKAIGDRAVEQNMKGSLADATEGDLSAGIQESAQKSESGEIVKLLGTVIQEGAGFAKAYFARQAAADSPKQEAAPAKTDTAAETDAADAEICDAAATTATSASSLPRSVAAGEGVPVVAILGNRATCSRCRTLWACLDAATLSASLGGASVIDADKADNAAEYARLRPKEKFDYPLVMAYASDGTLAGKFDAAGLSQAAIAEKVKVLVPDCCSTKAK